MGFFDSLFGGGGDPKAPKSSGTNPGDVSDALQAGVDTAKDYLNFAKDQFDVSQERQVTIDDLTKQVSDFFLKSSKTDRATYESLYKPLEKQFVETAQNYASPERQAAAAAQAKADVQTQATLQQGAADRASAAAGVNPSSGRYQGIDRAIGLGTALGSVDAENKARKDLQDKALQLQEDAINQGKQTQSAAATEAGAAASAPLAGNQQWQATPGIVQPAYSSVTSAQQAKATGLGSLYNSDISLYGQQADLAAADAKGTGEFLGTLAGAATKLAPTILPMLSDKNAKKNKKDVPEGKALEAVEEMPVQTYRYKEGMADGGARQHVGPMAQDFEKATGKGDGKTIPVQDAIGMTMKAVQDLSAKVDRMAEMIGLGDSSEQEAA